MSEHTAGPWHATSHFDNDTITCNCAYVLSEGYCGSICDVSVDNGRTISDGGNDAPPRAEAAANARLIAAAPELLRLARANLSTLEVQREAHIRWGKSHAELDAAIDDTQSAITLATTPARNTSQIGEG